MDDLRSLAMQSAVSKTFVAPRGTQPSQKIGPTHLKLILQKILLFSIISLKLNDFSSETQKSLKEILEMARSNLKDELSFFLQNCKNKVLMDSFVRFVQKPEVSFKTTQQAMTEVFVTNLRVFGIDIKSIIQCQTLQNVLFTHFKSNKIFEELFLSKVWSHFYSELLQEDHKLLFQKNSSTKSLKVKFSDTIYMKTFSEENCEATSNSVEDDFKPNTQFLSDSVETTQLVGFLQPSRSRVEIFAQNAVTFYDHLQSVHKPSVPAPVPVSQQVTSNLADHPVNDTTELVSAVVNELFEKAFANFIVKSAEAIGAGNQAALSRIFGEDPDANALRDEVAIQATNDESAAFTDASAALEVARLVNDATEAGESVFQDPPPNLNPLARSVDPVIQPSPPVTIDYVPVSPDDYFSASPEIQSLKNVTHGGDTDSVALFAAISSSIPPLSGQHQSDRQTHENGASGHLCVMSEGNRNGADQSGDTSPHSPDGEGRAHFTAFVLNPPQGVKDGALGAHSLFSAANLCRSAAEPKSSSSNLGSIFPSGQSGTPQTHEFADLLASLPILSLSFTTAHAKLPSSFLKLASKDVSPQAQSSDNPSGILPYLPPPNLIESSRKAPLPPPKTDLVRRKINGGGAQSSGNPIGNPPGNSDDADHPETPSSSKLWSSCIPGGKTRSSTQRQTPPSRGGWRNFFRRDKSNRVNPSQGETGATSPQVTHSSGKISSEFAATTTTLLPSSISPLGGNIGGNPGAHSPGDPPGFVPPSAPSSSSELGSAAATAANPLNEKPPTLWGVDIGGIECEGASPQFAEIDYLVLMMKYASAPWTDNPPLLWTHPCLQGVPNLARLARVA